MAYAAGYLRHRRGIENLLALAVAQLSDVQQDRIRDAVGARKDTDKAGAFINGTVAEGLGVRFLAALAAAGRSLPPKVERALVETGQRAADQLGVSKSYVYEADRLKARDPVS